MDQEHNQSLHVSSHVKKALEEYFKSKEFNEKIEETISATTKELVTWSF